MQERKTLRHLLPQHITLLPASPREWFSEDYLLYCLLDLIDELDLLEMLIPAQAKHPSSRFSSTIISEGVVQLATR
jgi:hypothetical protein